MRLLLLFVITCHLTASAQHESDYWYFGNSCGMHFINGFPAALSNGAFSTNEGCATISDSNGNLLFYSDGKIAYDKNHQPMPNGSGLTGGWSSTHSAFIVPSPALPNQYYLFTTQEAASPGNAGLAYSIIDMSLNNGLGDITTTKNVTLLTPSTERITATRHANGTDFWVLTQNLNNYYAFLINTTGVSPAPVVSNGPFISAPRGQMKVNQRSTQIGIAAEQFIILSDFNTATGVFSNFITVTPGLQYIYGLEFSPDGNLIYTNGRFPETIWQFNISSGNSTDISASGIKLSELTNNGLSVGYGSIQLAQDGRIYVTNETDCCLDVIQSPNSPGTVCNYQIHHIGFSPSTTQLGLPVFIPDFIYQSILFKYTCPGEPVYFWLANDTSIVSATWNFDDPSSGIENSGTGISVYHYYINEGVYTITCVVDNGTQIDTLVKQVYINYVDSENCSCYIFIPTAFSPNGDNTNDLFKAYTHCAQTLDLLVVNRWGNVVYHGDALTQGWNGLYNGKTAETGTYMYVATGTDVTGRPILHKGSVQLQH